MKPFRSISCFRADVSLLQELEEKLRAEQREMIMEDDLSRLAEAEYKDELERRAWREKEAQRIAEWEEAQRQKDLEEQEARKARSAELEVRSHTVYCI